MEVEGMTEIIAVWKVTEVVRKDKPPKKHWGSRIALAGGKIAPLCQGLTGILSEPPFIAIEDGTIPDCESCAIVLSRMVREGKATAPAGFKVRSPRTHSGGRYRRVHKDA